MMKEDKWLEKFRGRLEEYSEPLPDSLWKDIEQDLLADAPKVVPLWRRWQMAAAVALLAIVSSLTVWLWNSPTAQYMEEQSVKVAEEIVLPSDEIIEEADMILAETPQARKSTVSIPIYIKEEAVEETLSVAEETENELSESKEEKQEAEETPERKEPARPVYQPKPYQRMALAEGKKRKSSWAVGLSAGNMIVNSGNLGDLAVGIEDFRQPSILAPADSTSEESTSKSLKNAPLSRGVAFEKPNFTDYKHYMPITFGVSVRWGVNEDWALESGLTYTLLASDMYAGRYTGRQKLHYVGIPLKASRRLWSNDRWAFYAGAGGAVEKCVSGSITTYHTSDGQTEVVSKEDANVKELQWSLVASVGAQFKLTKRLGIYAEPGVVYYFDDGSRVETLRKEHPFNFNLQVGVRFTLGNK